MKNSNKKIQKTSKLIQAITLMIACSLSACKKSGNTKKSSGTAATKTTTQTSGTADQSSVVISSPTTTISQGNTTSTQTQSIGQIILWGNFRTHITKSYFGDVKVELLNGKIDKVAYFKEVSMALYKIDVSGAPHLVSEWMSATELPEAYTFLFKDLDFSYSGPGLYKISVKMVSNHDTVYVKESGNMNVSFPVASDNQKTAEDLEQEREREAVADLWSWDEKGKIFIADQKTQVLCPYTRGIETAVPPVQVTCSMQVDKIPGGRIASGSFLATGCSSCAKAVRVFKESVIKHEGVDFELKTEIKHSEISSKVGPQDTLYKVYLGSGAISSLEYLYFLTKKTVSTGNISVTPDSGKIQINENDLNLDDQSYEVIDPRIIVKWEMAKDINGGLPKVGPSFIDVSEYDKVGTPINSQEIITEDYGVVPVGGVVEAQTTPDYRNPAQSGPIQHSGNFQGAQFNTQVNQYQNYNSNQNFQYQNQDFNGANFNIR